MIFSIINQKGGVGKTTTSVNLAFGLSKQKKKTLVLDIDPQAHTTFTFNIERPEKNISHVLEGSVSLSEAIVNVNPYLSIVPSSIRLSTISEKLYSEAFREEIVKTKLDAIKEDFDFIIIDGPPTLGVLVNNIIYASDFVVIPCEVSIYSLEGMEDLIKTIKKIKRLPEFSNFKVLITKYDERNKVSNQHILEQLNSLKLNIFKTFIPRNESLNQASMAGASIFDFKFNSKGSQAYLSFTKEVMALCPQQQNSTTLKGSQKTSTLSKT